MSNHRVWIDPNDCGLTTVEAVAERKRKQEAARQRREEAERKRKEEAKRSEAAEEKRRREEAMQRKKEEEEKARTQALLKQPKQEILPPEAKAPALPDANTLGLPDLRDMERQIRQAAGMLDLSKPEGWLDALIGRPDHRIDVKTERGQRLARYISACTAIVETARVHQNARQQIYLDQGTFLLKLAQQQYQLEGVRRQGELQDAIEEKKAQEIIADYDARIREHSLRGQPAPPPPPPPPAPPPVNPAARKKEESRRRRQEMLDLELEELDFRADAGQEKVARAKQKAIEIFQNVELCDGEIRARIQEVLDGYGLDHTILPRRLQEFMEVEFAEEKANL